MSELSFGIRDEMGDDGAAVDAVLVRAFGGRGEAELVAALRRERHVAVSLVATVDRAVVAHLLFSRLQIFRPGNVDAGLSLAPLAVDPAFQRRGIGSALVRAGLDRARAVGERIVFVLGDPGYYGRFGFSAEAAMGFECVYACEALQAIVLDGDWPGAAKGKVVYPPPFAALGE
ncbi:MAG: GNAT family N-acetyltransferase [Planctomycetota bacterium]|nr:MAG: GNAT family N-acetyltransferase [Planctomycetota bacterium]